VVGREQFQQVGRKEGVREGREEVSSEIA